MFAASTLLAPAYQPRHKRHLAAVRAALDAPTFAAAWAGSRVLTLEAAIDTALDRLSPA
jgi:hypothetical protein